MKIRMTVVGNELDETTLGNERVRVTLKPYVTTADVDTIKLLLKPHEAKPYRLGRRVDVAIQPD